MIIKFGTMCRGEGVSYIEINVYDVAPESHIEACAHSEEGVSLPLMPYEMAPRKDADLTILYVTPNLATAYVNIEFTEVAADGSVVGTCKKTINRSVLKWTSRLNYRLVKDSAYFIRDTDKFTMSKQLHVHVAVLLNANTDPARLILKGSVDAPVGAERLRIDVIDGQGVDRPDIQVAINPPSVVVNDGIRRSEASFSTRIPDDGKTYCLIARDESGDREGFLCLDAGMRDSLLFTADPHFYRISGPGMYSRYVDYREKLLSRASCLKSGDLAKEHNGNAEPIFSIVVPLYKTPPVFFREMVDSVLNQTYQSWELVLVNASPDDEALSAQIAALGDARIRVVMLEDNLGIAANTNAGIEAATGDYIALFDHDDLLVPTVLEEYAKAIVADPAIDALYCDEDFLKEDGSYGAPHFKSDFNIDLLRCHNYVTHLLCVRATLLKELMLRSEFDGAQDYDLILRIAERTPNIRHIPQVLYHWRIHDNSTAKSSGNKNYADENGRAALQGHLDRLGLDGTASCTDAACFYDISYDINGTPKVSIVIPNKDSHDILERCITSIEKHTDYRSFEVVIVENNSVEEETFATYERLQATYDNIKVVTYVPAEGEGFNYSKINNFGVSHTTGEYLVLLNNDTEVIEKNWLGSMLSLCQRDDVGIVGAKLLYPDDTVQHGGVMMMAAMDSSNFAGPIHLFQHLDRNDPGYMRRASLRQDLTAVTAACLMTKRSVYEEVGGLDEDFVVAFNDVDYCLRVRALGLLVVYDPHAVLYHYESLSRGADTAASGVDNYARFMSEQGRLRMRWPRYFAEGDPYHGIYATKTM